MSRNGISTKVNLSHFRFRKKKSAIGAAETALESIFPEIPVTRSPDYRATSLDPKYVDCMVCQLFLYTNIYPTSRQTFNDEVDVVDAQLNHEILHETSDSRVPGPLDFFIRNLVRGDYGRIQTNSRGDFGHIQTNSSHSLKNHKRQLPSKLSRRRPAHRYRTGVP